MDVMWLASSLPSLSPFTYVRHQCQPAVIQLSVWLYLRFTFYCRNMEE